MFATTLPRPRHSLLRAALSVFAAAVLLCAGCFPENAAYMSLDGKFVARVPMGKENDATTVTAVHVLTIATGKTQRILLPDNGSAKRLIWLDGRLLVLAKHPAPAAPADDPTPPSVPGELVDPAAPVQRWWIINPADGKATPTDLPGYSWAIRTHYDGQACLELADHNAQKKEYFALDTLKSLAKVEKNHPTVADGWQFEKPDTTKPQAEWLKSLQLIKVADQSKRTIDAAQLLPANLEKSVELATLRTNAAGTRLLVVLGNFNKGQQWYFGLYDTADGKLLWKQTANISDHWFGDPAIVGDAVYNIEDRIPNVDNKGEFTGVLAKYTADGRTIIGNPPLRANDQMGMYTVSSDDKQFVVLSGTQADRILLVPIQDTLEANDVKVFTEE